MTSQHKPGIHEGFLLTRHIDLVDTGRTTAEALVETLSHEDSVDTVSLKKGSKHPERQRINVCYDASLTDIDFIVGLISASGGQIATNWLMRKRLNSYRFTDQNAHDNAKHQPGCCNKMPPGAGTPLSARQKK
ncbi:MAG: hypothetical protein DRR06_08605 [Gammaproteobacteria bacterium]|nr:MAG: hypothetical protein DRR42_23465 [Gammaproteobacteria bacterium]RLA44891.1 MAG: hypothetical protein DRR06_08605 [Gammaproteobacteria bacterium]